MPVDCGVGRLGVGGKESHLGLVSAAAAVASPASIVKTTTNFAARKRIELQRGLDTSDAAWSAALALARYLDSALVSVLPSDVVALVLAEAVLLSVGFAATLVPARRASRANPLDIIRAV